jgi:hypothetical protein
MSKQSRPVPKIGKMTSPAQITVVDFEAGMLIDAGKPDKGAPLNATGRGALDSSLRSSSNSNSKFSRN